MPTPAPSSDCAAGTRVYRLRMFDTGGDGWQGARYEVLSSTSVGSHGEGSVLTSGTLAAGYYGDAWMCLADGCYEVRVRLGGSASGGVDGRVSLTTATTTTNTTTANHPVSRDVPRSCESRTARTRARSGSSLRTRAVVTFKISRRPTTTISAWRAATHSRTRPPCPRSRQCPRRFRRRRLQRFLHPLRHPRPP